MKKRYITTCVGPIAVFHTHTALKKTPIIFLHGVYFDHRLWEQQLSVLTDRPVVAVDMPMHGESKTDIKQHWNLDDCATMLLEILNNMSIQKVIAIGHSWGSMTILRAAHRTPDHFAAVGLCNMPFKQATTTDVVAIRLAHIALVFRALYRRQAGKSLFGKETLVRNPHVLEKLTRPMSMLTNKELRHTDSAVRIDAQDVTPLIQALSLPTIAVVGKEDYVGIPPVTETIVVRGGHVSPIEAPHEVNDSISE